MNTPEKIANLLNRGALTVNQLAQKLELSRNSVHLQVTRLEAGGTIEKCPERVSEGAGKPAAQYRTAAGREDTFSSAYKPVVDALLGTISEDFPKQERLQLLKKVGTSLAKAEGLAPTGDERADVRKSIEVVNSLGAMAEFHWEHSQCRISCHSCPVATLVHKEPMTCSMVAAFFGEATGKRVAVKCRSDRTVICGFKLY